MLELSSSVACGNLPRPGLELMSPALAGGVSTTGPPGKSHAYTPLLVNMHIARVRSMK